MSDTQKYNQFSIWLHWIMFLLLVAVFACIELRELFPKGSDPRNLLKTWHFTLGLSVLALLVIRIVLRLLYPTPPITPAIPAWQQKLAKLMHVALYLFMLAMPIAGWVILSGEGKVIPFFGLELPALISPNKSFAHSIEEIHETVGEIGYYLIGLHTLAAIFHHHVQKDDTLRRMLPGKKH